ncbi:PREDICTED: adenylate cyclase type 10-like [Priapulus caudatus]|uniref:Adenylate cyclase type 10-like n=1 Tax=Priapulus caudatus TaxID=37621 RepID=A0ABM1EMB7_PRICU|nr:PREDICTED: adenylate cyclase type 10-like [Priapulus caudatus]
MVSQTRGNSGVKISQSSSRTKFMAKAVVPASHRRELHHRDDSFIFQLATHVPDMVVLRDQNQPMPFRKEFSGILMFADVSGFTSLTEKYSANAKSGADQLTKTLNEYIGAICEGIITADGDILKFAGDAILAVWPCEPDELKGALLKVIHCCLDIQDKYGEWKTDIGVKLRVKMAIACGELCVMFLGNDEFQHYVTTGNTVNDVNKTEKFCEPGWVVLSPYAWSLCDATTMEYQMMDDDQHVRVSAVFTEQPAHYLLRRTYSYFTTVAGLRNESHTFSDINKNLTPVIFSRPFVTASQDSIAEERKKLRFRRSVFLDSEESLVQDLRRYVISPVRKKIDDNQPVEFLSEMREVTIVFMNMVLKETTLREQVYILQKAFEVIYRNVERKRGCMNKIFMFDKGTTFLVIFGLPGYKEEDETANALQAAYRMTNELNATNGILRTSIGVTVGSTFCGVVGHRHRHEYTVIGSNVNKAARLMMYYPGRVTCDEAIRTASRMPPYHFLEMEKLTLKGIANSGTIYEYTENVSVPEGYAMKGKHDSSDQRANLSSRDFEYPLVGRQKEIGIIMDELCLMKSTDSSVNRQQLVVFHGDPGIGKTRLMRAIMDKAEDEGIRVIDCAVSSNDTSHYFAIKTLVSLMLDPEDRMSQHEKEGVLMNRLRDNQELVDSLCLLNDVLNFRFPTSAGLPKIDSATRTKEVHKILQQIVHVVARDQPLLFTVDDAHFMDAESWEFLDDLGCDSAALCCVTMRSLSDGTGLPEAAHHALNDASTLAVAVGGLELDVINALACQMLDVSAVPPQIVTLMKEKSHGVPSWCDQLLRDMYVSGKLLIVKRTDNMQPGVAEESLTRKRQTRRASIAPTSLKLGVTPVEENSVEVRKAEDYVCVIAPGVALEQIQMPDSMKGMLLASKNGTRLKAIRPRPAEVEMSAVRALACRSPRRYILERIIASMRKPARQDSAALQRLMERNKTLECANIALAPKDNAASYVTGQGAALVICGTTDKANGLADAVHQLYVAVFRFKTALMHETAYEVLLENQRIELHVTCARFLENQTYRCLPCGGSDFVPATHLQSTTTGKSLRPKSGRPIGTHRVSGRAAGGNSHMPNGPRPKKQQNVTFATEREVIAASGEVLTSPEVQQDSDSSAVPTFSWLLKLFRNPNPGAKPFGSDENLAENDDNEEEDVDEQNTDAVRGLRRRSSFGGALGEDSAFETEDVDLRNCQCNEVLAYVYPQLVRHWRAAGRSGKTVHALTEAGAAGIATGACAQALSHLYEADQLIKDNVAQKNAEEEAKWTALEEGKEIVEENLLLKKPLDDIAITVLSEGRVQSLIGQALLDSGRHDEAEGHFLASLKALGCPQPTSMASTLAKIVSELIRQYLHREYLGKFFSTCSTYNYDYLVEHTRCLSNLWQVYEQQNRKQRCYLAALQAVNIAEEVGKDFHQLIIAYTLMMVTCSSRCEHEKVELYEGLAMKRCYVLQDTLEADDMATVAHMFSESLEASLMTGRIDQAIKSGMKANKITDRLRDSMMKLRAQPTLARSLILAGRYSTCVDILHGLLYAAGNAGDTTGQIWYYAGCFDIALEAGFQVETFDDCKEFVCSSVIADITFSPSPIPKFILMACMALWYSRKMAWDEAEIWFVRACEVEPENLTAAYMAVHAFSKLVECELLALSNALSVKTYIKKMKQQAQQAVKKLGKSGQVFPRDLPRRLLPR